MVKIWHKSVHRCSFFVMACSNVPNRHQKCCKMVSVEHVHKPQLTQQGGQGLYPYTTISMDSRIAMVYIFLICFFLL